MAARSGNAIDGPAGITSGFVESGSGLLHYVRRGTGPAVVLLHASPCSARAMAPQQAAWSQDFTTFAFDLPGFGMSDLPGNDEVTIESLAETIAVAMRNLGLENAALYGRHTGASVCLALAVQHPDLCALLLTDGLPVFPKPYSSARLDKYLTITSPGWDGSYLAWTFFRYREQHMFWPWDAADAEHVSDADLPDADFLHRGTVEMLEAAQTYVPVYRSAFMYDTLSRLDKVRCPACYGNRPGDSQFKTIMHYPQWANIQIMPRDTDAASLAELELLRAHPAKGSVPAWSSRFGQRGTTRDYIGTRHGCVYAIGAGLDQAGVPTVFLPDVPGGVDLHPDEIAKLGQTGPVVAFDPAGNGNSDTISGIGRDLWTDQITDVVALFGWPRVRVVASGLSGAIAIAFAAQAGDMVVSVELRSPPMLDAAQRQRFANHPAPDITPTADGTYLLRLWHHLRDQQIWWPWFDTDHSARRVGPLRIDPTHLDRRAVTILKQARHYGRIWSTLIGVDLPAEIADLAMPVTIEFTPGDVFALSGGTLPSRP